MLQSRARCILPAHAARLSSGSRSIGFPLVRRRWLAWSVYKKGDPTVSETNGYILRRRQRGESLEKTLGYVSSIMAAGFEPNEGTLAAVMATDVYSSAQVLDLAQKLGVSLEKGDAWGLMFRNIVIDRNGLVKSTALDFAMRQYDALTAAGYRLPRNPFISLLHQASLSDMQEAKSIITWLSNERSDTSWSISPTAQTLLAAHLNVKFSNRAALFRRGIMNMEHERLHADPVVNKCIQAIWLSRNHVDAAQAIFELCGPGSTGDTFMAAWKVLCHTRYRQSYAPDSKVLRKGHDFAMRWYCLHLPVLSTFAIGYAASARKLKAESSDRALLGLKQALTVSDGAIGVANLINRMLGSSHAPVTRGALVKLVAPTGDHDALLGMWSSYCRSSPSQNNDVLNVALSACTGGKGLRTAREILRLAHQNWTDFAPDARNWATFIQCLADSNELQPALECARDRLRRHPDQWRALLPILDCACRMDQLGSTRAFLKTKLGELFTNPRVLFHASQLRKISKAQYGFTQGLASSSMDLLETQSKPTEPPPVDASDIPQLDSDDIPGTQVIPSEL